MDLTLQELLPLVGPLDNRPGFDAPRERFRRFLALQTHDIRAITSLIEQAQHTLGEQNYFALQDLVTLLGRFLGFETAFGTYQPLAGSVKYDGHWNSRGRMHAIIEVRSDQTHERDLDRTQRSIDALAAATHVTIPGRPLALCVVMPTYAGRTTLVEQAMAGGLQEIRVVSIRSLQVLAELCAAGKIRYEEILQMLRSGIDLDLLAGAMERCSAPSTSGSGLSVPKLVERR